MSTMKFVVAFAAFIAIISTGSAFVNIQVSAGNGQETYNMAAGASPRIAEDEAFASVMTSFDMSGEFAHTTRNDFIQEANGDFTHYTNDINGKHVHVNFAMHSEDFGDFTAAIDQDI